MAPPMTGTPRTTPFMSKRRTPKKGRDIGNDIFCKLCKYIYI